jgi:hypothetical protein
MSEKHNYNNGCSNIFVALLTVLFIGLKLTGHIDWSWWWVLSPIWISLAIAIVVLAIAGVFFYIAEKL